MSRIAKKPLSLPKEVEFKQENGLVTLKGKKGVQQLSLHPAVCIQETEAGLSFEKTQQDAKAILGTMRVLISNMVKGVSEGFERKLLLKGVGYRAKITGKNLELTLGKSHPDIYQAPEGITLACPSNTEVIVSGIDKQKVGQVAADIREFRRPEPYKGKGIRYEDEHIITKETKKKK